MVREVEKFHSYKFCPRCKADVEPHHRFCRQCTFWLARPEKDDIRGVAGLSKNPHSGEGLLSAFEAFRNFQPSAYIMLFGISLGGVGALLMVMLFNYFSPDWATFGPKAQRQACYSNMRVIQGAMEIYLQETRFTPALASNPVDILLKAGFMSSRTVCPIKGNIYRIPWKSGLQCIGSEGHGLPN